jgi:hypothetical protein
VGLAENGIIGNYFCENYKAKRLFLSRGRGVSVDYGLGYARRG